jgi:hypothetical protein
MNRQQKNTPLQCVHVKTAGPTLKNWMHNYFSMEWRTPHTQTRRNDAKIANIGTTLFTPIAMINANPSPQEIYQSAERLILDGNLGRFGPDKRIMVALFNVLAPVQWLDGAAWETYKVLMLPKLAWLAGNNNNVHGWFVREFYWLHKIRLCDLSQSDYRLFCEALKASYYFYCPER